MNINKIKTYVGFAIKSKAIVYGLDQIKEKKVKVIFFVDSMSNSSKQSLVKVAQKNECPHFEIKTEEMLELVNSEKIKALAILNQDLAKAIENNMY